MTAFRSLLVAAAICLAAPLAAEDHPEGIHIHDPYALVSPGGNTGAVFFTIHNNTATDIVLTGASTPVAKLAELHTHKDAGDGVMQMVRIEGGIPLPAGEMHALQRGGDHVMLMGLTQPLKDGDHFEVTLQFTGAEPVVFDVAVDSEHVPEPMDGMGMNMDMNHTMPAAPSN